MTLYWSSDIGHCLLVYWSTDFGRLKTACLTLNQAGFGNSKIAGPVHLNQCEQGSDVPAAVSSDVLRAHSGPCAVNVLL